MVETHQIVYVVRTDKYAEKIFLVSLVCCKMKVIDLFYKRSERKMAYHFHTSIVEKVSEVFIRFCICFFVAILS